MTTTTSPTADRLDTMFRAFSDRTRLRMLYLLLDGECCVGNLVEILGIEQPSVSRHLAYLRKAGLVSVRRDGLWCYYALTPALEPFHQKLLECLACCFSAVPALLADQKRARQVRATGGCCPGEEKMRKKKPESADKTRKADKCCPG